MKKSSCFFYVFHFYNIHPFVRIGLSKEKGMGILKMKKTMMVSLSVLLLGVMVGCGRQSTKQPVTEVSSSQTKASSTDTTMDSKEVKIISVDDAIKLYQEAHPDTDITSLELENESRGFVYKVEGVDDQKEYEVRIDATTKEIIKDKNENLERDGVKRNEEKLDLTDVISIDEATKIAEKEAGVGSSVQWDLDRELDVTYWEVEVKDGHKSIQVKLDAKTGKVLQTELDD